jgi:hypothetical protein
MILLWTPLFPERKGQTNHADACEKFVCPNSKRELEASISLLL